LNLARHNRRSRLWRLLGSVGWVAFLCQLIEAAKVTFAIATLGDELPHDHSRRLSGRKLLRSPRKGARGSHGSFSRHDGLVRMWPRSSGWGNEAHPADQDSRTSFPDKISAQTDIFWRAKKLSLYGAPPQRTGASGGLTKWAGARPKRIVKAPRIGWKHYAPSDRLALQRVALSASRILSGCGLRASSPSQSAKRCARSISLTALRLVGTARSAALEHRGEVAALEDRPDRRAARRPTSCASPEHPYSNWVSMMIELTADRKAISR